MGAAGRPLRSARRWRQAALRELHEEVGLELGEGDVLGLLYDYPTLVGLFDYAGRGVGQHTGHAAPDPAEVASVHRIALDSIEQEDAFSFTTIPESTRRRPLSHGRSVYPRTDRALTLSIPRSAGRGARRAWSNWSSRSLPGNRGENKNADRMDRSRHRRWSVAGTHGAAAKIIRRGDHVGDPVRTRRSTSIVARASPTR